MRAVVGSAPDLAGLEGLRQAVESVKGNLGSKKKRPRSTSPGAAKRRNSGSSAARRKTA